LLTAADRDLRSGIARGGETKSDGLRLDILRKFPLVFDQEMAELDLELIGCKESTWTRVVTVAKAHVIRTGADEMGQMLFSSSLPHPYVAIRVEAVRVFPGAVGPHRLVRDDDSGPLRDFQTIRQLDRSYGDTTHSNYDFFVLVKQFLRLT
jgi:hypothetical protein